MRKTYTPTFKAQVVRELLKDELTLAQIATKFAVHPTQLSQWKATAIRRLPSLFVDEQQTLDATKAAHEQQLTDLYAEIGKLTTQLAWLKKTRPVNRA
jgi:transposase-like protein